MSNFLEKKKRTIFARIVGKIKENATLSEQKDTVYIIPFDDMRSVDDLAAIERRRNELRNAGHKNLDAIVSFKSDNNDK